LLGWHGHAADVILVSDPSTLWFDPAVDITAEVIGALRARNVTFPASSDFQTTSDSPAETAPAAD
jgi:hypothetical protein